MIKNVPAKCLEFILNTLLLESLININGWSS
jgi:hypothetical protein